MGLAKLPTELVTTAELRDHIINNTHKLIGQVVYDDAHPGGKTRAQRAEAFLAMYHKNLREMTRHNLHVLSRMD